MQFPKDFISIEVTDDEKTVRSIDEQKSNRFCGIDSMLPSFIRARQDLFIATIPSFIRYIKPYSFSQCIFKTIEFPENSELKSILFK